ncbi:hypothetical protein JZU61_07710, partial [bacterium]|nr:hypothetical protein [bacterium]
MRTIFQSKLYLLPALFILMSFAKGPVAIRLNVNNTSPQVEYALEKMKELQQSKIVVISDKNSDLTINASLDSTSLKPEAYRIVSKNNLVAITGGDAVGLMYGLLEVKDQLKAGKVSIASKEESPNLMFRAIKFNLPWDSYRRSEALSLHYETCRDTKFWESFLDMM